MKVGQRSDINHQRSRQTGFTLVELVMVIIIVGVLAVAVIPRFADKTFDERGFHDAVKAAVQHARHVAVSSRRFVCVNISAGTVSLTRDTGLPEGKVSVSCTSAIALPAPGRGCSATNQVCAPSGVVLGGTSSLLFDPLGRLVSAPGTPASSAATLTISNQPSITVSPETGYVE